MLQCWHACLILHASLCDILPPTAAIIGYTIHLCCALVGYVMLVFQCWHACLKLQASLNNNNILYSSQWEIKAVIQSHDEEHFSVILSHETHAQTRNSKSWNTRTYTRLDIRPLSLNLHTLIANPKLPGLMLSLSNQKVKTFYDILPPTADITGYSICLCWAEKFAPCWFEHFAFAFADEALGVAMGGGGGMQPGVIWIVCVVTDLLLFEYSATKKAIK